MDLDDVLRGIGTTHRHTDGQHVVDDAAVCRIERRKSSERPGGQVTQRAVRMKEAFRYLHSLGTAEPKDGDCSPPWSRGPSDYRVGAIQHVSAVDDDLLLLLSAHLAGVP